MKNRKSMEKMMKRFRNLLILSLVTAGFLLAGTAAKADPLTLTLDSPYQVGSQSVFTFTATVTNTDPSDTVYLNGDFVLLESPLAYDDTGFVDNAPLSLAPLASSNDFELFTVIVPYGTPAGLYTGTFQILGGDNGDASDAVASANFDIQVDAVPEPSSFLLLAAGVLAFGFQVGRKLIA